MYGRGRTCSSAVLLLQVVVVQPRATDIMDIATLHLSGSDSLPAVVHRRCGCQYACKESTWSIRSIECVRSKFFKIRNGVLPTHLLPKSFRIENNFDNCGQPLSDIWLRPPNNPGNLLAWWKQNNLPNTIEHTVRQFLAEDGKTLNPLHLPSNLLHRCYF